MINPVFINLSMTKIKWDDPIHKWDDPIHEWEIPIYRQEVLLHTHRVHRWAHTHIWTGTQTLEEFYS
jgi:hypothetical protein